MNADGVLLEGLLHDLVRERGRIEAAEMLAFPPPPHVR